MMLHPIILEGSETPPWLMVVWVLVFVVIFVVRILASASRRKAAAAPPPPARAAIPPTLLAGIGAGRLVAPPPPPGPPRKVVGPPPRPPAARHRGGTEAAATVRSDFPQARASVSGNRTTVQSREARLPGVSILDELRSNDSLRSTMILIELLDPPVGLRALDRDP